jgi:hypothetical protein
VNEKQYVIAVRHDQTANVPVDWQARLASIPGVSIEGATQNRAQFLASAETIPVVKSQLGEYFIIEESLSRGPL